MRLETQNWMVLFTATGHKSLLGRHIFKETLLRVCVKHKSSPPLITKKIQQIFPEVPLWVVRESSL